MVQNHQLEFRSDLLLCIGKENGGKGGIMKPGGNGGAMKGNCPGIFCPGVPAEGVEF